MLLRRYLKNEFFHFKLAFTVNELQMCPNLVCVCVCVFACVLNISGKGVNGKEKMGK